LEDRQKAQDVFQKIKSNEINEQLFDLILQDVKQILNGNWIDFISITKKKSKPLLHFQDMMQRTTRIISTSINKNFKILKNSIEGFHLMSYYCYVYTEKLLYDTFYEYLNEQSTQQLLEYLNEVYNIDKVFDRSSDEGIKNSKGQFLDIVNKFCGGDTPRLSMIPDLKERFESIKVMLSSTEVDETSLNETLDLFSIDVQDILWDIWVKFCTDINKETLKKLKKLLVNKEKNRELVVPNLRFFSA